MLAGIAYLCRAYDIGATEPGQPGYQSILSQLVAAVIGRGVFYYITIGSVLCVLALSANTGFADFPRLCRIVAQDGFMPRSFAHRGRRLVYSHGILVLAGLSAGLLIGFGGITDNLIPLFAVGAFLAFTLSQAGMVEHWRRAGGEHAGTVDGHQRHRCRLHGRHTRRRPGVQVRRGGLGHDPLDPGLIVLFTSVHRHYQSVGRQIASSEPLDAQGLQPPVILLPIGSWNAITRKAMRFALELSPDLYALHIAGDENAMVALEDGWKTLVVEPAKAAGLPPPKLIVVYSPYRRLYSPLKDTVTDLRNAHPERDIAVIIPQLFGTRWYHVLLHNQTGILFEAYLRLSGFRRVVVINVPWYLAE